MPNEPWAATTFRGRPRFDGANISTFIGFKNFMTLAEEACLEHLRANGYGPQELFQRHGLGTEIVDSSTRLISTLHADDEVTGVVSSTPARNASGLDCKVELVANRGTDRVPVLGGKLRVVLVAEKDGPGSEPVPPELRDLVVPEVAALGTPDVRDLDPGTQLADVLARNGFLWSWQIPYFYCHWYTRMQSSGYVRLLEAATDRYLAEAGLSITEKLATRNWIPVVSRARVRMLADAYMGETLHITYEVTDVIKDVVWDSVMTCYVRRGDTLVTVARCTILHGYVLARGAPAFQELVVLSEDVQAQLTGGSRACSSREAGSREALRAGAETSA
jgi:acyl-CoA thioesterase FadM